MFIENSASLTMASRDLKITVDNTGSRIVKPAIYKVNLSSFNISDVQQIRTHIRSLGRLAETEVTVEFSAPDQGAIAFMASSTYIHTLFIYNYIDLMKKVDKKG